MRHLCWLQCKMVMKRSMAREQLFATLFDVSSPLLSTLHHSQFSSAFVCLGWKTFYAFIYIDVVSANASVETPWRADDDDETLLTSFSTEPWQTFVIKKKFFMPHSPQQQQHHPTRDNTTKLSHERVSQRASVEHGNMLCILDFG